MPLSEVGDTFIVEFTNIIKYTQMSTKNTKIEISLTDFVKFITKSGSPKLTVVKQIKTRGDYSPIQDFYKKFREDVINIHKKNKPKKDLKKILNGLTDKKKLNSFPDMIKGYKKFWGNKKLSWFDPPSKKWIQGNLSVRINPELGLEIVGSDFYAIKLYLSSNKLSKSRADLILTLMESELRPELEEDIKVAVLDVKDGKLYTLKDATDLSLLSLLQGEALSFESIWKNI